MSIVLPPRPPELGDPAPVDQEALIEEARRRTRRRRQRNLVGVLAAVLGALWLYSLAGGSGPQNSAALSSDSSSEVGARALAAHKNGRIAVLAARNLGTSKGASWLSNGVWRIDTINPDGSRRRNLTRCATVQSACSYQFFAWSPDGKRFAFERDQTHYDGSEPSNPTRDDVRLFVVSADGSGETRVPGCGRPWLACDTFTWAPDSRRIAFSRGGSVYVVDTRGGRPVRIIRGHCCFQGPFWSGGPFWSPDGSSILFDSTRGVIYRVDADGSGLARLAAGWSPSWSPDGRRIVFVSSAEKSISAMDADGSHRAALFSVRSDGGGSNGSYSTPPPPSARKTPSLPVWSPDGTQIAFALAPREPDEFRAEIWTMRANGTQSRRLYRSGAIHGPEIASPVWSPDGKLIAFGRPGFQHSGLVLLHASGKPRPRRLAPDADEFDWQSLPRSTK